MYIFMFILSYLREVVEAEANSMKENKNFRNRDYRNVVSQKTATHLSLQ